MMLAVVYFKISENGPTHSHVTMPLKHTSGRYWQFGVGVGCLGFNDAFNTLQTTSYRAFKAIKQLHFNECKFLTEYFNIN